LEQISFSDVRKLGDGTGEYVTFWVCDRIEQRLNLQWLILQYFPHSRCDDLRCVVHLSYRKGT
jgi:hypothetical protein